MTNNEWFDSLPGCVRLERDEQMTITTIPQPDRVHCDYCGSYSYHDMRGNCCCCGAPRTNNLPPMWMLHTHENLVSKEWARQNILGMDISSQLVNWQP